MTVFLKKYGRFLLAGMLILAVTIGILIWWRRQGKATNTATPLEVDKSFGTDLKISDNLALYKSEDVDKVYEVYLTVYDGLDPETGEIYSLEQLNEISGSEEDPKLQSNVYVVDPDTGEIVAGADDGKANSTVELRGQSARVQEQKSYKVRLSQETGTFQGQNILNLNKHTADTTRMTQKFCFDSMQGLPDYATMRTNFMHVFIKDGSKTDSEYQDYGLFTHVENPDDTYLEAHGMYTGANFYKPRDFEFMTWEIEQNWEGELYDTVLKNMGSDDIAKLERMVFAINDSETNYDEVFDTYFDRDNYLTWLATNLLFNNYDTMSRNFLLYSPPNIEKWYFLPWDYDACLFSQTRWEQESYYSWSGLQRYWGSPLHRKFFQNPDNVQQLCDKVEEVYDYLQTTDLQGRSERYAEVYRQYVINSPADQTYLLETRKVDYEQELDTIRSFPQIIDYYHNLFYQRLQCPMPFFLGDVAWEGDSLKLLWSDSYDLQNDALYYEVALFTDPDARDATTLFSGTTASNHIEVEGLDLPNGRYYWESVAVDPSGNRQISFDRCKVHKADGTTTVVFGLKSFIIKDGQITNEASEEE